MLRSQLAGAKNEIERLRAMLCRGEHDFVLVDEWSENGMMIDYEYVCTRCGQRKVESI